MNFYKATLLLTLSLLLFFTTKIRAQENVEPLTSKEKIIVIDSIGSRLNANYVFPEVAKKMAENIEQKLKSKSYKSINDPYEFANQLTTDLQAISNDKHIRVRFSPQDITEQQQVFTAEDSLNFENRYINRLKRTNFGFKEVKILDGNVGYLDLRGFMDVAYAGKTAVSAMNYLSNSDAIIIDLRFNGGGSPAMIQLITSYLFESEPVHLNNFYWRPTDSNTQTWTLPHVSGKRSPDTPVYVLTSSRTFSAAEEFSYNLKNLERATLVGETTGGGAHPGSTVNATNRFSIFIPTGRAINPITNTNWEGTGVSPHISVPSKDALRVAYTDALEKLSEKNNDEEIKSFYNWPIASLKIKNNPIELDASVLKSFIGQYGPRKVTFENGTLFYQREKGVKYELYPFSQNEFMLKGLETFRIRFLSENDSVEALQGLYNNGHTDKNLKE